MKHFSLERIWLTFLTLAAIGLSGDHIVTFISIGSSGAVGCLIVAILRARTFLLERERGNL